MDAGDWNIEVVGIKDALRTLNQLDPTYRRQITRDFKDIAEPVVSLAKSQDLKSLALSGFDRKWTTKSGYQMFPLDVNKLNKFVISGTSGKKPKEFRGRMQNTSVFFIRWKSPQATLLEMAAKGELGRSMSAKSGPPGRVLWKAWEQKQDEVMDRVEKLVKDIMKQAQRFNR